MPPTVARTTTPRWPFCLLLAAWFCANMPPAGMHTALTWLAEARTFSHQQRLTSRVAAVLVGEAPEAALDAAAGESVARPVLPPPPAKETLKKLDLALEGACELPALASRDHASRCERIFVAGVTRAAPPHGPPRSVRVV